nr:ribonuclease H-like domain, reverse transcriptase, RNA-dependent DNA polymerase [Tanacetum cinerariifolium]
MTIEESKDLTLLSLDELIRNLKGHEMIIKKDSEIVKAKGERKFLALKAKKESSDEECSTSKSKDEEYAMAVRDFKKFFKRRECPKTSKDKNQRAFIKGSWSDSGEEDDEKAKDETCLVAQASNKICLGVDLEPDEWIKDNGCSKHMTGNKPKDKIYLATINENSTLWHRRSGHANMRLIQSLASKELVRNLPKLKFDQHLCDACNIGKQAHVSHKAKNIVSTTRCLELLHMDIFGPSAVRSYGGNRYTLLIVDYYSRPDIMFSVCLCARFQQAPKTSYLEAVKRIFQYIKGTTHLGLWYPKGTNIETVVYADSDHVGDYVDRKSTSDVKSAYTLIDLEKPSVKDGDANDVDVHLYRSMIRSHLLAVKRIFRYLKGKPTLGLCYSRDYPFELVAYTDSDYAGATQDRKSTTGGCQFLGNKLISWQCKKHTMVATSTTEDEYVAAAS